MPPRLRSKQSHHPVRIDPSKIATSLKDLNFNQSDYHLWENNQTQSVRKIINIQQSVSRRAWLLLDYLLSNAPIQTRASIALTIAPRTIPQQILVDREDHKVDWTELMRMYLDIKKLQKDVDKVLITDKSHDSQSIDDNVKQDQGVIE